MCYSGNQTTDISWACAIMVVNRKTHKVWYKNLKRQPGRPWYVRILSQQILIRIGGVDWMHLTQTMTCGVLLWKQQPTSRFYKMPIMFMSFSKGPLAMNYTYFCNRLQVASRFKLVHTMTFGFTKCCSLWYWALTTSPADTYTVDDKAWNTWHSSGSKSQFHVSAFSAVHFHPHFFNLSHT